MEVFTIKYLLSNDISLKTYGIFYDANKRGNNEDSIILHKAITANGEMLLAGICDGLGGMDSGEIASGYISEELSKWFYKELPLINSTLGYVNRISKSLQRKVFKIHNELRYFGKKHNQNIGSTLVILFKVRKKLLIISVGDSAIYSFTNKVKLINKIDSYTRHKLSSCIGIGNLKNINIHKASIVGEISFLLCSDGFYEKMNMGEFLKKCKCIRSTNTHMVNRLLKNIGNESIKNGANDNMSAILLAF